MNPPPPPPQEKSGRRMRGRSWLAGVATTKRSKKKREEKGCDNRNYAVEEIPPEADGGLGQPKGEGGGLVGVSQL